MPKLNHEQQGFQSERDGVPGTIGETDLYARIIVNPDMELLRIAADLRPRRSVEDKR
jgi:hypothetical protein